jgi:pimeloyl-ACP methyl ester carboxylesterase
MTLRGTILVCLAAASCVGQTAPQDSSWHDPSPHSVQFVTVEEKVRLEVLDWGGKGQSVVLLAGLGNTAHVFDNFAPKLTTMYHVYGITRRGYGASSAPDFGYSADRLGDDVLAVIDALKLERPVLAGNSLAGEELSSVGSRHPEKVAGLIYLDAAYAYAYYDRTRGDLFFDLLDLERKLDQLHVTLTQASLPALKKDLVELRKELTQLQNSNAFPEDPRFAAPARRLLQSDLLARLAKDMMEEQQGKPSRSGAKPEPPKRTQDRKKLFNDLLQTSLPGFEKDLREAAELQSASKAPAPVKAESVGLPEAELRVQSEAASRGHAAAERAKQAILQGRQKYTYLRGPILAIYCLPHQDEEPNEAADEAQAKAFESGVRSARVVRLPHANSLVFLSNEADVLREMNAFLGSLE